VSGALTAFERRLLNELAEGELPPAALAVALDSDLGTVLETTAELQARGLVERQGFDTCRLTDRGREHLAERPV
jgi:Mn-dependent DtxR family transcriptional regulator